MITRDSLIEFIELHRIRIMIVASAILLVLMLVLLIAVTQESARKKDRVRIAAERAANALHPDELWLPAEPLPVPGVQLFRERKTEWTAEDADVWYIEPDADMMGKLEAEAAAQVTSILEQVP